MIPYTFWIHFYGKQTNHRDFTENFGYTSLINVLFSAVESFI